MKPISHVGADRHRQRSGIHQNPFQTMEAHAAEMVVILTGSIVRITRTETEMRTPGDLAAPLNPHGQAERHFAFQLYPTVRPVRLVNVAPAKSVTRSHSGRGGGR